MVTWQIQLDNTRRLLSFGFAFNLSHKDQTTRIIIDLKTIEISLKTNTHLRMDNSGEFVNNDLQTHWRERALRPLLQLHTIRNSTDGLKDETGRTLREPEPC